MKLSSGPLRRNGMTHSFSGALAATLMMLMRTGYSTEPVQGRPSVVIENGTARLVVDTAGGSIGEFRLRGSDLNPLSWSRPGPRDVTTQGFGHFLCLDRWGPPSEAEGARGMPYHGEAAHVQWTVARETAPRAGMIEAEMSATLPMAGLTVRRRVRMSATDAVFAVREEVANRNALGRIYNMVQHPTIAPPFLDGGTLIDCNGQRGFAQDGALPTPEEPSFLWPQAFNRKGAAVDMRRLGDDPEPNVVSYKIDSQYGWVVAAAPAKGLLIGYLWPKKDYPWVSLWRDVRDGKPAARGLEFGTTGLHQPFPILVKKGRIWDQPLFEYLDSGETVSRQYLAFLLRIPADFTGVESLEANEDKVVLQERGGAKARKFTIAAQGLIPQ